MVRGRGSSPQRTRKTSDFGPMRPYGRGLNHGLGQ